MHGEPLETGNRRFRPLPDIADNVVKLAERETVDGARRRPVLEVDVARRCFPVRLVRDVVQVAQAIPFIFRGQAHPVAGFGGQPVAKRLGLEIIDLHGPVPGHVDLAGHGPQPVTVIGRNPEQWVAGL